MIHFNGYEIKFVPQDLWIGVYWKLGKQRDIQNPWDGYPEWKTCVIYICILPMFPIILHFSKKSTS